MDILYALLGIVVTGTFITLWWAPIAWATGDALKRGKDPSFILPLLPLFSLFGPLAALVWWAARPQTKIVECAPESYSEPDDALLAAAQLDQLGEWDRAMDLYDSVDCRWPAHHDYVSACKSQILEKQALAA